MSSNIPYPSSPYFDKPWNSLTICRYNTTLYSQKVTMQANPFRWFKPVISPNPDKEGLSKPQRTHKPLLWKCWALFVSLECGEKSCDAVWSFCDFKGISAKQGAELEDHGIRLEASEKLFTPQLLRINFPIKAVYWSNSLQLLSNAMKCIACIWIVRNVFYSCCLFWVSN